MIDDSDFDSDMFIIIIQRAVHLSKKNLGNYWIETIIQVRDEHEFSIFSMAIVFPQHRHTKIFFKFTLSGDDKHIMSVDYSSIHNSRIICDLLHSAVTIVKCKYMIWFNSINTDLF